MDIESVITGHITNMLKERNITTDKPLNKDTMLLDTGLDSLSFAVLVVRLESELGYDPFVLMEEPIYPRIFGEFVEIYERYKEHRR